MSLSLFNHTKLYDLHFHYHDIIYYCYYYHIIDNTQNTNICCNILFMFTICCPYSIDCCTSIVIEFCFLHRSFPLFLFHTSVKF